jgi:hypothetical protein
LSRGRKRDTLASNEGVGEETAHFYRREFDDLVSDIKSLF